MNFHEYQAKNILESYGVSVPEFAVAGTVQELIECIDRLRLSEAVLKIQVHAGGRGKGGGVQFARSPAEIVAKGKELLGMRLINAQTGPGGVVAHKLLISKPLEIANEYYVSALIDRSRGTPLLIVSAEGGMEIEEIAQTRPEKIMKIPFSFDGRLRSYHRVAIAKFLGWHGEEARAGTELIQSLARAFVETDASLLEINPLVRTKEGAFFALDAKLSVDDNALFRHKDFGVLFDPTQVSRGEAQAREYDLAYIAMEGDIGCMVNGAGLAMATMDIIQLLGGRPANFLDVGGSASKERVAEGFRIILSDPKVRVILINIFGGIMNCATIAAGVLQAAEEQKIDFPLVVRLEGTHAEEGRALFQKSRFPIHSATTLQEAAEFSVKAAKRSA
ncbi:MAG: ADP-forming succinate--CoA ligase subunit beta [Verrucomicrobiota bacterium]|nr:ADP-forming succinate--CoA ligase subunit beta [Verrucomicrobiota bacterium]